MHTHERSSHYIAFHFWIRIYVLFLCHCWWSFTESLTSFNVFQDDLNDVWIETKYWSFRYLEKKQRGFTNDDRGQEIPSRSISPHTRGETSLCPPLWHSARKFPFYYSYSVSFRLIIFFCNYKEARPLAFAAATCRKWEIPFSIQTLIECWLMSLTLQAKVLEFDWRSAFRGLVPHMAHCVKVVLDDACAKSLQQEEALHSSGHTSVTMASPSGDASNTQLREDSFYTYSERDTPKMIAKVLPDLG